MDSVLNYPSDELSRQASVSAGWATGRCSEVAALLIDNVIVHACVCLYIVRFFCNSFWLKAIVFQNTLTTGFDIGTQEANVKG